MNRRVAALGVAVLAAATHASVAGAAGEDVGDAAVVDAADAARPVLDGGDASTVFSLDLPAGASCPGDSANDQWRVQTFLVPATDDPAAITYAGAGPAPDGAPEAIHEDHRWGLYDVTSTPFADELTQRNPEPGRPGLINTMPPFSFAGFTLDQLPAGDYRIGVACTLPDWATGTYWDNVIRVEPAADLGDGAFRWRVVGTTDAPPPASGGSSIAWVAVGLVAIAAAALVVALRRRTASSTPSRTTPPIAHASPTKEHLP